MDLIEIALTENSNERARGSARVHISWPARCLNCQSDQPEFAKLVLDQRRMRRSARGWSHEMRPGGSSIRPIEREEVVAEVDRRAGSIANIDRRVLRVSRGDKRAAGVGNKDVRLTGCIVSTLLACNLHRFSVCAAVWRPVESLARSPLFRQGGERIGRLPGVSGNR